MHVTSVVPDTTRVTLWAEIEANIARGTILHTDEYTSYRSITLRGYRHQRVNHSAKQYVAKDGTTNVADCAKAAPWVRNECISRARPLTGKELAKFENRQASAEPRRTAKRAVR